MADLNTALALPSLRETFAGYFKFGNILTTWDLENPEMLEMFRHHFDAVTAENAMKPVNITPAPGEYDFSHADKLAEWAGKNGIDLIGHTLCWHAQSAPWLNKNEDGTPLTRSQAKSNLESFIKTYAGRYSGKVYSWDVVNEPFIDSGTGEFSGDWRDYVRRETDNPLAVGHWFLAYANGAKEGECGTDYIFDAFYFARKYDPHAILYVNEYNEEYLIKRTAIAQMVGQLNEKWANHPEYDNRLLIEGIGMQCHQNHNHIDVEKVRKALELFSKTGARISVTEMDFTFGSHTEPAVPLTPEQSRLQSEHYAALFGLFMEYSEHIERVTMWGINDGKSWRKWGSPTFFDADCQPKEAFFAVTAVGKGVKINFDCVCPKRACPNHGDCDACESSHTTKESPPACKRG